MSDPKPWTCRECQSEQTDAFRCEQCGAARYQTWDIMVSEHVLEHIAEGLSEPLEIQKAMNARPCYANIRGGFQLTFIVQRIRMLTRDTRDLALKLIRAKASVLALKAIEHGDTKDAIAMLAKWGPETNAERVEHSGSLSIEGRLHEARKRSAAAKEPKP